MSETRIRELFAEAAEDMPVGPAPDLAGFVAARRTRRRLAAVSVGLVAAAAVGVVVAVSMRGDSPSGAPANSPDPVVQTTGPVSLDCRNDTRSGITWEGTGPYRRTPQGLAKLFTNPAANEYVVLESVRGGQARVALIRGNGTAWAELRIAHNAAKGWFLGTVSSCEGRYVRMYWQRQDHLFN